MLTYTGPVLNNDVMKDDLTVTVTDVWMNVILGDMITKMRTSLLIVTQNNNDIVYGLNAISLWIKSDTNRNILQIKHFIHSILWNTGYFGSYIKTTADCSRLTHGLKAICSDFTQNSTILRTPHYWSFWSWTWGTQPWKLFTVVYILVPILPLWGRKRLPNVGHNTNIKRGRKCREYVLLYFVTLRWCVFQIFLTVPWNKNFEIWSIISAAIAIFVRQVRNRSPPAACSYRHHGENSPPQAIDYTMWRLKL